MSRSRTAFRWVAALCWCGSFVVLGCDAEVAPTDDDGARTLSVGKADRAGQETTEPVEEAATFVPNAGVFSIGAEQGIDIVGVRKIKAANWGNSDIFATPNGGGLKLSSGGSNPTKPRPVNWFIGANKKPTLFATLDDVPAELPPDVMTGALPKCGVGVGFVVQLADGGYAKGLVRALEQVANSTGVVAEIAFETLPE